MATMTAYDQIGKKEDVSNVISNIAPTKTPFQSMIGSDSVKQTLYQWQEDSLDAPAANAAIDGAAAPSAAFTPTVMRSSNTQIFTKTASVSGTADAVDTYGRGKELAYQLTKKSKEIKRDFEIALVGLAQVSAVGNSSTTARKMDGFQALLDSTHRIDANTAGTATVTTNTGTVVYTGGNAATALSENLVLASLQLLYNDGAEANVAMIRPQDATKFSNFIAGTSRIREYSPTDRKVVNVVDVYVSPFNDEGVKVVLNRFLRGAPSSTFTTYGEALFFDASQWKKAVLRNWFRQKLAVTGDSTQMQLLGEFGLKNMNYKSSILLTNLAA